MYLHLGQNTLVRDRDIIGIFDLDNASRSFRTREFLSKAEKNGEVIAITEELPRSFVLTGDRNEHKVLLCQLSAATLQKRSEKITEGDWLTDARTAEMRDQNAGSD